MSRQRIRTGVLEGSTVVCPHCMGGGVVRSTASIALHVLRVLEDALIKSATHNMTVRTRTEVALYILNQKRRHLRDLERRFGVTIMVAADETLTGLVYHALERGEPASGVVADEVTPADFAIYDESAPADEEFEDEASPEGEAEAEHDEADAAEAGEDQTEARAARPDARSVASAGEDGETVRRRRRRRRRRGERGPAEGFHPDAPQPTDAGLAAIAEIGGDLPPAEIGLQEPAEDSEPGEGDRPRELSGRHRRARGPRRGDHERGRGRRFGIAHEAEGQEPSAVDAAILDASPDEADAGDAPPEAARGPAHLPPSAVHESVADGPVFHEPEAPQARGQSDVPANASADAESPSGPDATATGEADDPSRPKRSGWWRRARATFVGE